MKTTLFLAAFLLALAGCGADAEDADSDTLRPSIEYQRSLGGDYHPPEN
jgi:hypothetical protein